MSETETVATRTEQAWSGFEAALRGFVRSRVRTEADADDVLQEVFAKVHAGIDRLESGAKLEAWLYQIARNALIDHYRRHGRDRATKLPEEIAASPPSEDVEAEVASWLAPIIEGLGSEDREALRLADLEGITQRELAERLGVSLSGAKSRVQRARKRVLEAVNACCALEGRPRLDHRLHASRIMLDVRRRLNPTVSRVPASFVEHPRLLQWEARASRPKPPG